MSDDFKERGGSPWGTPPGGGSGNGQQDHIYGDNCYGFGSYAI